MNRITISLNAQRLQAAALIDQAAAQARLQHLSGYPGQELVYAAKLAEAQAYLAAQKGDPKAVVPPYVAADVEVDGGSAVARAQAIVRASETFHAGPGPAIELVRRRGKAAVRTAKTGEELQQAVDQAIAALEALAAI